MSDEFLYNKLAPVLSTERSTIPGLLKPEDQAASLIHEAVEVLLRRRGKSDESAITVRDLAATLTSVGNAINDAYVSRARFEGRIDNMLLPSDGKSKQVYFDTNQILWDGSGSWDLAKRGYAIRQPGMYLIVFSMDVPAFGTGAFYDVKLHLKITGERDAHKYFLFSGLPEENFSQQATYLTHISEASFLVADVTLPHLVGTGVTGDVGLSIAQL